MTGEEGAREAIDEMVNQFVAEMRKRSCPRLTQRERTVARAAIAFVMIKAFELEDPFEPSDN